MKILIADDHDLVRDTVVAFLEREGGFRLTAVEDMSSALEAIEKDGPFDLVLLDYSMPGMNGLGGLEKARAQNGGWPVAIMSGTADRSVAQEALDQGAGRLARAVIAHQDLEARVGLGAEALQDALEVVGFVVGRQYDAEAGVAHGLRSATPRRSPEARRLRRRPTRAAGRRCCG